MKKIFERIDFMKTKKAISLLLSLVMLLGITVFSVDVSAATTDSTITNSNTHELAPTSSLQVHQNYLEKVMATANISGVAYVTHNGRVVCQHANGSQNTKENKPMTMDTLFPLGSASKQFCATAVLMLQDQGKLSVDDKLSKYFPEYTIGKDVTIHQMLSMRSGIRDHVNQDYTYKGQETPLNHYTVSDNATYKQNQKKITDWLFSQKLKFTPDTSFSYSNANYLLLSMIVEQVSGQKYSDFIKENIFKPLNMTNSGFYEELVESPNLAEPCIPDGNKPFDPYHKGVCHGAGDLVSNAADMDKWLNALSDNALLSDKSYNQMTTSYTEGEGYGYGIIIDETQGSLSHQGNIITYESYVLTIPQKNINIFVITNDIETVNKKNYTMALFAKAISKKVNSNPMIGDINNDGDISIVDATAIQLHLARIKTLTNDQIKRADTNGDSKTTILDATQIQFFLAKK